MLDVDELGVVVIVGVVVVFPLLPTVVVALDVVLGVYGVNVPSAVPII